MDTSDPVISVLKSLGFILVVAILAAVGANCLFYLFDGIVAGWKESNRINTEIKKACLGSEVPGMITDKQWTDDGSILVMCDNGKERWVKVVR